MPRNGAKRWMRKCGWGDDLGIADYAIFPSSSGGFGIVFFIWFASVMLFTLVPGDHSCFFSKHVFQKESSSLWSSDDPGIEVRASYRVCCGRY
jgi:hypothetical protein